MAKDFKPCLIDGCNSPHLAKGFCRKHYMQNYDQGVCTVEGCSSNAKASGLCAKHKTREARHGNLEYTARPDKCDVQRWVDQLLESDTDECLAWPFSRHRNGYGKTTHNGRSIGAHRLICILTHGAPPTGHHQAAHSCGKGHLGCVNPKHLRWATPAENCADRVAHGKSNKGTTNGAVKLSEREVLKILALENIERGASVARKFNVSDGTVYGIWSGRKWGWLTNRG